MQSVADRVSNHVRKRRFLFSGSGSCQWGPDSNGIITFTPPDLAIYQLQLSINTASTSILRYRLCVTRPAAGTTGASGSGYRQQSTVPAVLHEHGRGRRRASCHSFAWPPAFRCGSAAAYHRVHCAEVARCGCGMSGGVLVTSGRCRVRCSFVW